MEFITGTYFGRAEQFAFLIRFDFDRDSRPGYNIVSGDFYESEPEPPFHVASFLSESVEVSESDGGTRLDAQLLLFGRLPDDRAARADFVCLRDAEGVRANIVVYDRFGQIHEQYRMFLERRSDHFRTLTCQLDYLNATGSAVDIERLHRQAAAHLAAAGIDVVTELTTTPVEDQGRQRWNEGDLYQAMFRNFRGFRPTEWDWRVYLLVATWFRDDETTGIMFDNAAADRHHRQGAALFWQARQSASPHTFERDYVRGIVHELGHTLNLIHTFESSKRFGGKRASLSFMNYPHAYTSGPAAYWASFHWAFDLEELTFMRHGRLDEVVMGAAPFGYGNHERAGGPFHPERGLSGLRLTLRVRALAGPGAKAAPAPPLPPPGAPAPPVPPLPPPHVFRFGEPVRVEAKLANASAEECEVRDTLHPSHLQTHYLIEKPGGQVVRYAPKVLRCSESRTKVLGPDDPPLYEDVCLSYGAEGFYFIEPGRYRVQAVHRRSEGTLVSNVLEVWVAYPDRDQERLIIPTFDEAVADYFSVWGTADLHETTRTRLTELLDQKRNEPHPLVDEFERCQCYLLKDGVKRFGPRQRRVDHWRPSGKDAVDQMIDTLGLTKKTLRRSKTKRVPAMSNIMFGHLAGTLARTLRDDGKGAAAKKVLKMALNYLADQGLSEPARKAFAAKHTPGGGIV